MKFITVHDAVEIISGKARRKTSRGPHARDHHDGLAESEAAGSIQTVGVEGVRRWLAFSSYALVGGASLSDRKLAFQVRATHSRQDVL
jgi:hypothetical protein